MSYELQKLRGGFCNYSRLHLCISVVKGFNRVGPSLNFIFKFIYFRPFAGVGIGNVKHAETFVGE